MANWYDWLNPVYTGTQIGTAVGQMSPWNVGSKVGGYLGQSISGMTNSAVDAQEKYNADQAQLQRDFEERMSNTAYQRAVEDLKAAGLNPWLAVQNGGVGASTPSGSAASSSSSSATRVYGMAKILGTTVNSVTSLMSAGINVLGNIASSALKIIG